MENCQVTRCKVPFYIIKKKMQGKEVEGNGSKGGKTGSEHWDKEN